MDNVLGFMRQGKSRAQAASAVGVPLSRVTHWYTEGKNRFGTDNMRFYREVKNIEDNREIIKRREKARKERLERERRQRERDERVRKDSLERERKQKVRKQHSIYFDKENEINEIMEHVLSQMRKGKSRAKAASAVGISLSKVNDWYDKGSSSNDKLYNDFFRKVKSIEETRRKYSTSYQSSKTDDLSVRDKMKKVVSAMRNGKSKHQAVNDVGITIAQFNKWYNLGKKGIGVDNKYFYNEISKIEKKSANTAKTKENNKPKTYSRTKKNVVSKSTSQLKTKSNNKPKTYSNTKKTKTTTSLPKVNYCPECGKKITFELYNCSRCGASLKDGKKTTRKRSTVKTKTSSTNQSSFDLGKCCGGIIVVFLIFAILRLLI